MISELRTVDSAGKILRAGGPGVGFALVPASDPNNVAGNPGAFPVRVRLLPAGQELVVPNSDSYFLEERFRALEVLGATANEVFQVVVFETRGDGRAPAGRPQRRLVKAQASTAVPSAAPTLATDGLAVLPGQIGWQFYFSGTAQVIDVYQLPADGAAWFAAGSNSQIDMSTDGVAVRLVYAPGGRIALKAPGAGSNVAIDRIFEVG